MYGRPIVARRGRDQRFAPGLPVPQFMERLEREIEVMRDSSSLPKDDILALIDKPRKAV